MKRSLRETLDKKSPEGADFGAAVRSAGAELPGDVNELVDKYKGMDENELMKNLLSETRRRKADGSFDMASIRNGMNAILPMLNGEQKKRLYEIVGRMERE